MHAPQRLRVQLERQISTHEETLGKAVRNAARRIEYKHHLTAIGVQGPDSYNKRMQALSGRGS
jgi:hypothetical protein